MEDKSKINISDNTQNTQDFLSNTFIADEKGDYKLSFLQFFINNESDDKNASVETRLNEILKARYIDEREHINLFNTRFTSLFLRNLIYNVLPKTSPECISIIYVDVNGLKKVNDILGHEKGNELLKLCSDIFRNGKTVQKYEKENIFIVGSHINGDEYLLITYSSESIQDKLKVITDELFDEIFTQDVTHIVNLKDNETVKKLEKANIKINPDDKFMASACFGYCTLKTALEDKNIQQDEIINNTETLNLIMNEMLSVAEKMSVANKEKFKQDLISTIPFLYQIYAPRENTEVSLKLQEDKLALEERLDLLEKVNSDLLEQVYEYKKYDRRKQVKIFKFKI